MPDIMRVREAYPILSTEVHGRPLVYLDNAATMQMPRPVWDAVELHYRQYNANVHRGVHSLSQQSTDHLERARKRAADFIGADEREVIFTAGTTDGLNQLSRMLRERVRPGDQILVSAMEHHSDLLPWQELAKLTGGSLRIIPLDENGDLDLEALTALLKKKTVLAAVTWVSNVTGAVNPVAALARLAHEAGHGERLREVVEVLRRVALLDLAVLEHDHARGHAHALAVIAGDHHEGAAQLLVQHADLRAQVCAGMRVQQGEGGVQQQHLGAPH